MATVASWDHESEPVELYERRLAAELDSLGVVLPDDVAAMLAEYETALADSLADVPGADERLGDLIGHSAGLAHELETVANAAGYYVENVGDNGMTYIYDVNGPDEETGDEYDDGPDIARGWHPSER